MLVILPEKPRSLIWSRVRTIIIVGMLPGAFSVFLTKKFMMTSPTSNSTQPSETLLNVQTMEPTTNMGAGVMLATMGPKKVAQAKRVLGRPASESLKDVCAYMLGVYEKTYPGIKGRWYESIIKEIGTTGRLVSLGAGHVSSGVQVNITSRCLMPLLRIHRRTYPLTSSMKSSTMFGAPVFTTATTKMESLFLAPYVVWCESKHTAVLSFKPDDHNRLIWKRVAVCRIGIADGR